MRDLSQFYQPEKMQSEASQFRLLLSVLSGALEFQDRHHMKILPY